MQILDQQRLTTPLKKQAFFKTWEQRESFSSKEKMKIDGMIMHYIYKK